jgi:S1-C subfamily serine protease
MGDSNDVGLGDSIVTVGNAGGTGTLTVKSGRVVRLNRSITVRTRLTPPHDCQA